MNRFLAAYCLGFLIGGGIAAYCGHYGWNRTVAWHQAVAWRMDGSQEAGA